MEIRGLQGLQSISGLTSAGKTGRSNSASEVSTASQLNPVDQLDLSAEAQGLGGTSGVGETAAAEGGIRTEKVAALRRAIAEGSYDTPERLSAALDRMLDEIA